jgi:hypothetical protein
MRMSTAFAFDPPVRLTHSRPGSFSWTNAGSLPAGNDYRLTITSNSNGATADTSAPFTLGATTDANFATHARTIDVNRFVADEPVAFTKPDDVNDPTLYPFYQGVYGYRSQARGQMLSNTATNHSEYFSQSCVFHRTRPAFSCLRAKSDMKILSQLLIFDAYCWIIHTSIAVGIHGRRAAAVGSEGQRGDLGLLLSRRVVRHVGRRCDFFIIVHFRRTH